MSQIEASLPPRCSEAARVKGFVDPHILSASQKHSGDNRVITDTLTKWTGLAFLNVAKLPSLASQVLFYGIHRLELCGPRATCQLAEFQRNRTVRAAGVRAALLCTLPRRAQSPDTAPQSIRSAPPRSQPPSLGQPTEAAIGSAPAPTGRTAAE